MPKGSTTEPPAAHTDNRLPVNAETAAEIGSQGIRSVAIYLYALLAKHGRKREARKFRKLVRRAGYVAEAAVDLRDYHQNG